MKYRSKAGKPTGRFFGRIWLDEEAGYGDVINVSVTNRGKLLVFVRVGEKIEWIWMCFDHSRTMELIDILSEGRLVVKDAVKDQGYLGSLKYDISDWLGGPFDSHQGELLVHALYGDLELTIQGHPKNDGEDWTVTLNSRVALQLSSSVKKAEPYLKEVAGQSRSEFEPGDMAGRFVQYDVNVYETPHCPRFPPARITRVIQGQYPQPNYIVEFSDPVAWRGEKGYDVSYLGIKRAVLMARYHDRFEALIEKHGSREPIETHLHKLKAGVNPDRIKIGRVGKELEGDFCRGTVRLLRPTKRLLKRFENR